MDTCARSATSYTVGALTQKTVPRESAFSLPTLPGVSGSGNELTRRAGSGPASPQLGVATAGPDQLVVRPGLDGPAALEHEHPVGELGLGQPVRDDQRGAAGGRGASGPFQQAGARAAGLRGGLVEDREPRGRPGG